jgi:16S rRNA (cytidine1402-2'-O)-methyltransferase
VGPPREVEPASEAEMDVALHEAMATLSPSRAAAEVAARLGLPKRAVYERAQQLK